MLISGFSAFVFFIQRFLSLSVRMAYYYYLHIFLVLLSYQNGAAQFHLPFLIRETARKHQFTFAHCTVWQRV